MKQTPTRRKSFYLFLFLFLALSFRGTVQAQSYCNFQIGSIFGMYNYDNIQGNNFVITGVSLDGCVPLNFTGGTSDAGKPTAGYNQGIFTSMGATVVTDVQHTLIVTLSTGANARQVRVYVDWNDNFNFTDPGDLFITQAGIAGSVASTNPFIFNVPSSKPLGSHRMRIVCEYQNETQQGSCGLGGTTGPAGDAKDFTLTVTSNATCSGTPDGRTASATTSSVCVGGSTTISLNSAPVCVAGLNYQWQKSFTGTAGSFSNIQNETGAAVNTGVLTNPTGSPVTVYYQCVITCGLSGQSTASNVVGVTIQPAVQITGTASAYTITQGSPTQLNATGATTYKWSPGTGLSSISVSNPVAAPQVTTIYTVTGTTAAGCTGKDTVKVTVNPIPAYCNFRIANSFLYGYIYDNTEDNNFWITGVTVNGSPALNFTGGTTDAAKPSAGYNQGIFTSLGASVIQGVPYNWTVTVPAGTYARQIRVYVDWNDNFSFSDAGENIIGSGNLAGSITTTGPKSFTIPLTAAPGAHRMRVVCEYASETQQGSCGNVGSGFDGAQGDAKDFTLTVISATPCSGTPAGGSASANPSSVCINGSSTINLSGQTSGVTGITYQWAQSATGTAGSFTDIPGATLSSYKTPALANATSNPLSYYYQCNVTCTASGQSTASASTTVTVQPKPVITASAASYTINSGENTALTATGALTYKWSPGTGLSSIIGPAVTAFPQATTVYTVTGTTAGGCTGSDTVKVNVNQVSNAYCNYKVLYFIGLYGYDNLMGNNFWITGVNVNGSPALNFTGGTSDAGKPSPGYNQGVFTSFSGTVMQAQQYAFTVTRPIGEYNCQIRIYVDWNDNNSLTDAGELILTSPTLAPSTGSYTGNFIIPATAATGGSTTGSHRMRVICEWADEVQTGPCGSPGGFDGQGDAKDFTLIVTPASPCTGTPTAGTATAVTSSLCLNGSTTINLAGQTLGVSGIGYQWQSSAGSSGPFSDIAGATALSYKTPALANGTSGPLNYYYRCVVRCANSGLSAPSTTSTVTVHPAVVVTATAASYSINAGSSTVLSATGATTYIWSPQKGLSPTSGATVTATPSVTTIYRVTGITGPGCIASDTAKVNVIYPPSPYCNFQVMSFFGLYGYDNASGNNFVITGVTVNGAPTSLNFTGGTSDAAKPSPGYNQGTFLNYTATVRQTWSYNIQVSMSTGSLARQVRVYVDWNNNNNFTDAGENVVTSGAIAGSVATTGPLSFTVPGTASKGLHRMRVVCEYQNETQRGSCGQGADVGAQGDAKDFTLDVKDVNGNREGESIIAPGNSSLVNIYPNPNSGNMTVEFVSDVNENEISIDVINMLGQCVYHSLPSTEAGSVTAEIHLSALVPSGIYMVRVSAGTDKIGQKLIQVTR